jgi:DNA-binding response OmpR family regulator
MSRTCDETRATVLIVDDEPAIRELMKAYLEIEGFEVITARNGLEGLRSYKRNKDRVNLIITDLDMPAMNGDDMIRQICRIAPAMKVIVASGRSASFDPETQRSARTCRLQKPYTGRELTEAVHRFTRGGTGQM